MTQGLMTGGLVTDGLMTGYLMTHGVMTGGLVTGGLMTGDLMTHGLVTGGLMTGGLVTSRQQSGTPRGGPVQPCTCAEDWAWHAKHCEAVGHPVRFWKAYSNILLAAPAPSRRKASVGNGTR
jgi:hypothetical protein